MWWIIGILALVSFFSILNIFFNNKEIKRLNKEIDDKNAELNKTKDAQELEFNNKKQELDQKINSIVQYRSSIHNKILLLEKELSVRSATLNKISSYYNIPYTDDFDDILNDLKNTTDKRIVDDASLEWWEKQRIMDIMGDDLYVLSEWTREKRQILEVIGNDYQEDIQTSIINIKRSRDIYKKLSDERDFLLEAFLKEDNMANMPYIASLVADYKTIDLERMAMSLDWGANIQRQNKVRNLRELRQEEKEYIEQYKTIQYQLDYLILLYPEIEDILTESYSDIKEKPHKDLGEDIDPVRYYISKEEYDALSDQDKNQLALDRYIESRKKSKWQIGRDYELYVGYGYEQHGYSVNYFGSTEGINDLGRDLIATKGDITLIVQCKYWSKEKTIHEKHIAQLYGTYVSYCIEHSQSPKNVKPVFITSTSLSDEAKKFCEFLNVSYRENYEMGDFPRIKCVKNDEKYTMIYHLPMDLQYDSIKLDKEGRFTVMTVAEAEEMGYRRAYKWHGI